MLRQICGRRLIDRILNVGIRNLFGVASIIEENEDYGGSDIFKGRKTVTVDARTIGRQ